MRLEELNEHEVSEIGPLIGAIRHDLGRYICFEQRFLEDPESEQELRRALRSDLLRTRRSGTQVESCQALWSRLRPSGLDGDPDIHVIDRAIGDIILADLEGPLEELLRCRALAMEVRHATQRLHARHMKIESAANQDAEGWKNG